MQPPPPSEIHGGGPPKKSNLSWLWIAIGVVVVCGCGGIGVLGSILAPAILRFRAVASARGQCITNVRHLVAAQIMYSSDWDGRLPNESTWIDATKKYTQTETDFTCPTLKKSGSSYGYAANAAESAIKYDGAKDPSSTILIYETADLKRNATGDPSKEEVTNRHGRGRIEGFLDGHARTNRVRVVEVSH
jgi:hypothetical protein